MRLSHSRSVIEGKGHLPYRSQARRLESFMRKTASLLALALVSEAAFAGVIADQFSAGYGGVPWETPAGTSNSSTRGRVKLLHWTVADGG